jgi:peptidyl-prolyl cis-trans isomerase SurA
MNLSRSVLSLLLAAVMAAPPALAQDAGAAADQPAAAPVPTAPAEAPAPAPQAPPAVGESVAAVVNDEIISTYDLRQRMLLLIIEARVRPTQAQLPAIQRAALQTLIEERLQLQELRRREREQKIEILPAETAVEGEFAELAERTNLTPEQFEAALRQAGVNPTTLRERLRIQAGWERWIRGRYGSRLRIGDDQVQATLQRISNQASRPQYLLSELFLDAGRVGGMDEAMNGAQQLIAQIQQGAPFGAVARQFSAAPSAAADGDAGWMVLEEIRPALRPIVEQMRPGQVSQPIPVTDGVWIVQLRQRTNGAGSLLVNLKQAAVRLAADAPASEVEAARARLTTLRGQLNGCTNLEQRASGVEGVVAGDLGEVESSELLPEFRQAAQALQVGQVSEPIRTAVGLHLVAVCGKRTGGAQALTADQVENRLYGQQLDLIARRYMRDLRNSATIETR